MVKQSFEKLKCERLVELLETYLDRADEAYCLAEFLKQNHLLLFNSSRDSILIKFWDLLMSLLIQVDQESSRICCDIIFSIHKLKGIIHAFFCYFN